MLLIERASLLVVLSVICLTPGLVKAADLDDGVDVPDLLPIEAGASGFYARLDGSWRFNNDPEGIYRQAGFGAMLNEAMGDSVGFGIGAGYRFNEYLRFDATVDYGFGGTLSGDEPCPGTCTTHHIETDYSSLAGFLNVYADLGTYHGLTPYLGAGAGVAQLTTSDAKVSIPLQYDGASQINFAYALMAGVSYDISDSLTLDIGYRYADLGDARLQPIPGSPDGDPLSFSGNGFQEIRAGLRYNF